ncbi:hypothetical protein SAMN05428997_13164 [Bosea sp. CRIB-10]|uniref:NrsF family protein n=1 Tax=Bosea sp. CRIB-10 TaxID=378404 RepID=UPI0008E96D77|nr:DUF1109 domain-containing protein [Bosea sp. CRIB-10]SFD52788.1 hypothetical protein SAMN05428997_13164 [Bosea sp. CRIB-10]
MKTDELISLLSAGNRQVDTARLRRMTWLAGLAALVLTAAIVVMTIGARRDLSQAMLTLPVIAKFVFGASVAAISLTLFQRSLRPGLPTRRLLPLVAIPIGLVGAWAALTLFQAPPEQRTMLIVGRHWVDCLVYVPLFALCPLAILASLARHGAPVDRGLTSLLAGLASAGLAAVAYALHCPDDTVAFLATWYTAAVLIAAAFATVALPRLLRW